MNTIKHEDKTPEPGLPCPHYPGKKMIADAASFVLGTCIIIGVIKLMMVVNPVYIAAFTTPMLPLCLYLIARGPRFK